MKTAHLFLILTLVSAAVLAVVGLGRTQTQTSPNSNSKVDSPREGNLSKRVLGSDGGVKEATWSLGPEITPPEAPKRRALTYRRWGDARVMEDYWGNDVTVYGEGDDKTILVFGRLQTDGASFLRAHLLDPAGGTLLLRYDINTDYVSAVSYTPKVSKVARSVHHDGVIVLLNDDVPRIVVMQQEKKDIKGRSSFKAMVSMDRRFEGIEWGYWLVEQRSLVPIAMYEVLSGSTLAVEWSNSEVSPWAQILMLISLRDQARDVQHLVTPACAARVASLKGCTMIAGSGIRYIGDDGEETIYCTQIVDGKEVGLTVSYPKPIYSGIKIMSANPK